jgi:hypothetical protein
VHDVCAPVALSLELLKIRTTELLRLKGCTSPDVVDTLMEILKRSNVKRDGKFHLIHEIMLCVKHMNIQNEVKKELVTSLVDVFADHVMDEEFHWWIHSGEIADFMQFMYVMYPKNFQSNTFYKLFSPKLSGKKSPL